MLEFEDAAMNSSIDGEKRFESFVGLDQLRVPERAGVRTVLELGHELCP